MNYAEIKDCDVANGIGVRVSLFVSGCRHHCKGCFNEMTWDFAYGEEYTEAVEEELLNKCAPPYMKGLSLLGGEPLEPENQEAILGLLKKFKERFPEKTVWCYSGYTFEQLTSDGFPVTDQTAEILSLIDVLVDGPFILEQKNIMLKFRGSENQRLIDLPASLLQNQIVPLVLE